MFFNKKTGGFTLVEILVVIAIMGVLMTIIIASIANARAKSRDNKRISDLKEIQLALEQYYDQTNNYPSAPFTSATNLYPYLPSMPTDPNTSQYYSYDFSQTTTTFCLGTLLEVTPASTQTDEKACPFSSTYFPTPSPTNFYSVIGP